MAEPSISSDDSDLVAAELLGDVIFGFGRALLSARPEDIEELEELGCCCEGLVRAREERRGDMSADELQRLGFAAKESVIDLRKPCEVPGPWIHGFLPLQPLSNGVSNVPWGSIEGNL